MARGLLAGGRTFATYIVRRSPIAVCGLLTLSTRRTRRHGLCRHLLTLPNPNFLQAMTRSRDSSNGVIAKNEVRMLLGAGELDKMHPPFLAVDGPQADEAHPPRLLEARLVNTRRPSCPRPSSAGNGHAGDDTRVLPIFLFLSVPCCLPPWISARTLLGYLRGFGSAAAATVARRDAAPRRFAVVRGGSVVVVRRSPLLPVPGRCRLLRVVLM